LRRAFEATNHELTGALAVYGDLAESKVKPLPSEAAIQRILARGDTSGHIDFLNDRWLVRMTWIGAYVRATVNIAKQDDGHESHKIRQNINGLLAKITRGC
jgi:hypothetical protein